MGNKVTHIQGTHLVWVWYVEFDSSIVMIADIHALPLMVCVIQTNVKDCPNKSFSQ